MTEDKTLDKGYREPWDDLDVDQLVYEKALALKRFHRLRPKHTEFISELYGWKIDATTLDNADCGGHGSPKHEKERGQFQNFMYVIDLAYQQWYEHRKAEWDKTSQEAVKYNLLEPSQVEPCPHVLLDDDDDFIRGDNHGNILVMASYYDLIAENQLSIFINPGDHGAHPVWTIKLKEGTDRHERADSRLWDALANVKHWVDKRFDRERDEVAKEATRLGILEDNLPATINKPKALASPKNKKIRDGAIGIGVLFLCTLILRYLYIGMMEP